MADITTSPRPFDKSMLEHLIELMAQHDLSELDLHEGENRIRLRRGTTSPLVVAAPVATPTPAASPVASATAPPASATPATPQKSLHEIKSPMVGTFYAKPTPDKDDYVKVGSKIKADTVVCKLEAMKLFNDLPAECTGTIAEVCVQNGQPVDFGTVLFRVELG